MGVLRLLAAAAPLAAAACYEPRLADCVVRCSSNGDCAPSQACSAQGYCAAPELACTPGGPGPSGLDAAPGDARRPDGASQVALRTRVSDGGKLTVEGVGTCDAAGVTNGDCTFFVAPAVRLTIRAIPHDGYALDRWTSAACAMADATCLLTPIEPLTEVRVRFMRGGDGLAAGGE